MAAKTVRLDYMTENAEGNFIVEASDLQLSPGEWPNVLVVEGDSRRPLFKGQPKWYGYGEDRELGGWWYNAADSSYRVLVLND